jgi:hypothetical protein
MRRFLSILAALLLTHTVQAGLFSMTDGSAETWGGTSNGDGLSLNHFNTGGPAVVIDQINACWNPLSALVSPTLVLYSDPNGDGSPSDAQLLLRFTLSIQPGVVLLNQTLQSYSIPPTTVTGSFFVGTFLSDRDSSINPHIGIDTSTPQYGQSWIIENSRGAGLLDLNNPIMTSSLFTRLNTYINGNFMIEAQYSVIPEPSTGCLAAVLLGCATALRRVRCKRPR